MTNTAAVPKVENRSSRAPLRFLIVEDAEADAELETLAVERAGIEATAERVDTAEALNHALDRGAWDAVLCDYDLPALPWPAAFEAFKSREIDIPFIVVSGTLNVQEAADLMLSGVTDIVMKDDLARLPPALKRELRAVQDRCTAREAQEKLFDASNLLENIAANIPGSIYRRVQRPDSATAYEYIHANLLEKLGQDSTALFGDVDRLAEFVHPDDRAAMRAAYARSAADQSRFDETRRVIAADGSIKWFRFIAMPSRRENGEIVWDGIALDVTVEQRAIDQAHERDEMLRALSENAPGVIYQRVLRADGTVSYPFVSKGSIEIYGYTPEEIAADPDIVRRTEDDSRQSNHDATIRRSADNLENWSWEGHIRRRDGKRLFVQAVARPRRLENGDTIWDGFAFDLTDRHEAEEEARRTREYLETVLENMAQGVLTLDKDMRVVHLNNQLRTMLYYPIEVGEPFETAVRFAAEQEAYGEGSIDSQVAERLNAVRQADGEPVERLFHDGRSIEIRHMRLPDGGYVLTYTNMTERRLAEQELRKLFRAVEQSPTGIVIFNSEYVIEYANPKFTDITGYSSTEVIGQTTTDLFARLYQLGRPEGLTDALENGLDWSGEYIGQRRDGDYFWLRDTMAPIFGDDEALTHWISISEDITDLKSVQSDLVHASKLTTLGEMAASLTHELNQPLNVIRMAADSCLILAEDGDTNPEFMIEQFDTISEQTQRMAEIIRHMRIFSRKDEDETAEVRLIEVIENGVRLIKDEFRLANIDLRVDIPERCPPVRGYPVRVEQILVNLLTNARDAIVANAAPGQGANEKIGWVEIAMAYLEDVNSVIVLVRDSGGGIPDQALPKIFESFYTTKPSGKGTGLGLSVAQSIIREMGGQISVTNIDDGAEFRITLPALRKARTKRGGKP